jgi:hypothetical protein
LYDQDPSEAAFEVLVSEMLNRVRLPFVMCLGNHDISPSMYHWHVDRHGRRGDSGWSWVCPAAAFTVADFLPFPIANLDLTVINTNKIKGVVRRLPPADAPGFYSARGLDWWKQQKLSLESHLAAAALQPGPIWSIVVGHHPCEFVPLNFVEHRLPVLRYFKASFMRGSRKHNRQRFGLAHIIRRGSDLYLCGHQHIFAAMRLRGEPPHRPVNEARCTFVVVGASSRLDQSPDDFDGAASESDIRDPERPPSEAKIINTKCYVSGDPEIVAQIQGASVDGDAGAGAGASPAVSDSTASSGSRLPVLPSFDYASLKSEESSTEAFPVSLTEDKATKVNVQCQPSCTVMHELNSRYALEWRGSPNIGFVSVEVAASALTLRYYYVDVKMLGRCWEVCRLDFSKAH